jgi:hypothetical protein
MKKIFKGLLILASLLVVFLMAGMLLPENLHIERSIVVRAPAAQVYPYISDFRLFNQWSPWAKIDADIEFQYEGAERGLDAIVHWQSEHARVGKGSQKIIHASQDEEIKTVLAIDGMGKAYSGFKLVDENGSTKVVWSFDVGFDYNIPGRIMGLMMKDELGVFYERGLNTLKQTLEGEGP